MNASSLSCNFLSISKGKEDAFFVILDGVEDPHNLGSVIRVCECAGVDGLVIGKRRSACVNETVMRVSEGSANHLRIARVTNINTAIDELKEAGVWVYACELGGSNIYKSNLNGKICLVIGGEDTGVNRLTKEKSDATVTIPTFGKVNSLNASVACGVAVFEAVRQRNGYEK
jgi:23S rRNA (guanosine2251-2'-O)-methyltransferase